MGSSRASIDPRDSETQSMSELGCQVPPSMWMEISLEGVGHPLIPRNILVGVMPSIHSSTSGWHWQDEGR